MYFYQHTQKCHLIICCKAEKHRSVQSLMLLHWQPPNDYVFVYLCMFLPGRGVRMVALSQHLLTGVNTLSTSLCAVSTSLKSVWWKQKWQDDGCHPLSFSLVFALRQLLLWASQAHLNSLWTAVLLHYCADKHGHLRIRVLLLNRTDRWVEWFQLLMWNICGVTLHNSR